MASVAQGRPSVQQAPLETFAPKSSFMGAWEYDVTNLTLTTHMMKGGIYQHKFVTPGEWEALKTSQNHSSAWSQTIRGKKASVIVKSAKAPRSEEKHKHRNKLWPTYSRSSRSGIGLSSKP